MSKPYISVVIPLYNKEAIVERSVRSVLDQSFTDFELIIVDDGSTDRSAEIVRGIYDDRIIFIQQENGGPSKARNTGVKYANADWIVFLDADDEFTHDALEVFARLSREYPEYDVFDCGRCLRFKDKKIILYHPIDGYIKHPFKAWFYHKIAPGAGSTLFSKKVVAQCPFSEKIRRYEDGELLTRLFLVAKIFSSPLLVKIQNVEFSAASRARKDINEDFVGDLDFKGKGFWHKMCLYRFYIEEREYYKGQIDKLYPTLRYRYDLLLMYKLLLKLKF